VRPTPLAYGLACLAALSLGCSDIEVPTGPEPPLFADGQLPPPPPPPTTGLTGRQAFEQECAGCHTNLDGFDLAFFSYPDSTILRRAVKHVSSATAQTIASYIRSLSTPHVPRTTRLFQPGGGTATSDIDFAIRLFGRDAWPSTLTATQLRAINPLNVRIAQQVLLWSDERSSLDWLPDVPLPPALLTYAGGAGATALAAYRASPTIPKLTAAVSALYAADHASANPGAPCMFFQPTRVNYEQCYEARRWMSTLIAVHMLRNGITQPIGPVLHNLWWEVGDAARRSRGKTGQVADVVKNWAVWMYLGWMYDPARVPAVYTTGGLRLLGLNRHAAFVALRSLVARPAGSYAEDLSVYIDFRELGLAVPAHWATPAATLALRNILDRLSVGDRPPRGTVTTNSINLLNAGMTALSAKVSLADKTALNALAALVRTKLLS
jgi:hypothetical protein